MADAIPSTLEKLALLVGKTSASLTIAGTVIQIGEISLAAVAQFLDTSGADLTELDKTHAEYQRRIALARDPHA